MPALVITPSVFVPDEAMTLSSARSGGPGGQHVNKVESKIELRVALSEIRGLTPGAQARLAALLGSRLTKDGVIVLAASDSRHQIENRQLVLERLASLIRQSLVPPKPRVATRPTKGSQERRIEAKKRLASKKQGRSSHRDD